MDGSTAFADERGVTRRSSHGSGRNETGADMAAAAYDPLAAVYEWLVPDALLEPEGAVAAFAAVVDTIAPGARVLDCAAGIGQLAVGLALKGFEVVATDASAAMLERARRLARRRGVDVPMATCAWEDLPGLGLEPFAAVFCVGNSLTHAVGARGRRAALTSMRALLRPGGLLVVTSRNWERVRASGAGLQIADRLVDRGNVSGLVIHGWHIADRWDDPHRVDVAVALLGEGGTVAAHVGRLAFWPFRHETLQADLRACGFVPLTSTHEPDAERYLVTARRNSAPR